MGDPILVNDVSLHEYVFFNELKLSIVILYDGVFIFVGWPLSRYMQCPSEDC